MELDQLIENVEDLDYKPIAKDVGIYRVSNLLTLVRFFPASYPTHKHNHSDESITIIGGKGVFHIGEEAHCYAPTSVFDIEHGTPHGLDVKETTYLLSLHTTDILETKDIIRC